MVWTFWPLPVLFCSLGFPLCVSVVLLPVFVCFPALFDYHVSHLSLSAHLCLISSVYLVPECLFVFVSSCVNLGVSTCACSVFFQCFLFELLCVFGFFPFGFVFCYLL